MDSDLGVWRCLRHPGCSGAGILSHRFRLTPSRGHSTALHEFLSILTSNREASREDVRSQKKKKKVLLKDMKTFAKVFQEKAAAPN